MTILVITDSVQMESDMVSRPPADPEAFLPLKPRVFLMLLVLVQGGQAHGYALKDEVRSRTNGRLDLGPGTLYRTIRSMLEDRLIEESPQRPGPDEDDERRRYYRITEMGRAVTAAEATRLGELVDVARAERLIT
jgi:DNA-binding PadR family transcriptional regulator